jgi:hypothetical protein
MKRTILAAAVATAPLLLVLAGGAQATTEVSSATSTPIATATANNGAADNVDIASGGSITPTVAGTVAATLNSNNTLTSEGAITFSNLDNVVGIKILGGNTGLFDNAGSITISESYTAPTNQYTGIAYGNWASGGNRIGILLTGPGSFTGPFTNTGAISVVGNNSYGIVIDALKLGDINSYVVTPATSSTAATIATSSITVTGNGAAGFVITPNGGVTGNLSISTITARGVGAQGVVIDGDVGGAVNISSSVSASGYRSTTRPTTPFYSTQYTADQLEQGGAAVNIGASIGRGLIISAPPAPMSTTNLDQDGNGVPDSIQGTGNIESDGGAPALQIGSATRSVELGEVGTGANGYGLVVQGNIVANGVYDPLIAPNLPNVVNATGIQIGGFGGGSTILDGGIHSTGAISAVAYQASATAIHLGAGAVVPSIVNDGPILASSTQDNSATTAIPVTIGNGPGQSGNLPPSITIPAPKPVTVTGLLIDAGADITNFSNSRSITAELSGTGGVGGNATAIEDYSGTLANVYNTGNITAELNQTYIATPMPGTVTAIDMSRGTGPQSITQSINPNFSGATPFNLTSAYAVGSVVTEVTTATTSEGVTTNSNNVYIALFATTAGEDPVGNPTLWKEIGTTTPTILGSIYFGNGGSTLTVNGGTIIGTTIDLGSGVNTVTVNGPPTATLNGVVVSGASATGPISEDGVVIAGTSVSGYIKDEGNHTLTMNVISGMVSDTNPNTINANSINVGANGTLLVAADPANKTNTLFLTTGTSTIASGAQLGVNLLSVQYQAVAKYNIIETTGGGTLTAGAFGTSSFNNAPWLYTATPTFVASDPNNGGASEIQLTVTRRTPQQLGFSAAEGAALDAVLQAIPANDSIQQAILAQTTEAGLKGVYDQLLPNQGQGIFDALDAAAQSISDLTGTTPDAGVRVPGTSLWLQEVNERVSRTGIDSVGSYAEMLGLVAGWEHEGPAGGAVGMTLAYMNAQETDTNAAVGAQVVGSMVEGGLYYRRSAGAFTVSMRGGAGYAWFGDDRKFLTANAFDQATSNWGGVFFDGHFGASYQIGFGRYYARPEVSADYIRLDEGSHTDVGGGPGFDLFVADRDSTRFSGEAVMVLGTQWGRVSWLRAEIRGGYREVFSGQVGDTTANFTDGNPFTLASDPDQGGWATFGFSLKTGTPYSYVALEGDADLRAGEQRYDLRIAGRSLF